MSGFATASASIARWPNESSSTPAPMSVCVTARPGSATRTEKPYQRISRTVRVAGLGVQPGHLARREPAPHGEPAV